jgi:plastocyanin
MRRLNALTPLIGAIFLILGASGCNDEQITPTSATGVPGDCTATKAQLAVYDGFIQNLCGCQEAPEQVFPPNSLTCTISPGTTVIFWYIATNLFHQIQSTANPTFPTSPLSDPNAINPIRAHVVTFGDAGNYEFADVYDPAINGTIVVQ